MTFFLHKEKESKHILTMALDCILGFDFFFFFDSESLIAQQRQTESNLQLDLRALLHSGIFMATKEPPCDLEESIGTIKQHQSIPITHHVMFFS